MPTAGLGPGSRLYKTGDRARFLPDGNIEFLGRLDHQVKLRGFRIELGEIESVLSAHPAVSGCLVLCREDTPGDKRLVTYVVAQPGGSLDPRALRPHLAQKLPDYMIPSAFVLLDALPLTPNGKVDRKALPAPSQERGLDAFVPPRNPIESDLVDIFSSVLRIERIGIHDDFFAMDGNSLSAIRAVSRAQQVGFSLTLKTTVCRLDRRAACCRLNGDNSLDLFDEATGRAGAAHCRMGSSRWRCIPSRPRLGSGTGCQQAELRINLPIIAGAQERPDTVERLAAVYAQDIVEQISEGSIVLIGYSFCGHVALDLAQQLLTKNRVVEQVILLDARIPSLATAVRFDAFAMLARIIDSMGISPGRIQGLGLQEAMAQVASVIVPDDEDIQGLISYLGLLLESFKSAEQMLDVWQPHLPPIAVHLLRAEGDADRGLDYGWGQYGTLASVQAIPRHHESILQAPYLETTMQVIRALLACSSLKEK